MIFNPTDIVVVVVVGEKNEKKVQYVCVYEIFCLPLQS